MTTTPQTEASRLADELDHEAKKCACNVAMMPASLPVDAAKELRRLDTAHTVAVELAAQYAAERDQLRAHLAKAVAEEREACAKVCEYQADRFMQASPLEGNKPYASHECAAAIRARSST